MFAKEWPKMSHNALQENLYNKMNERLSILSAEEIINYVFRDTISTCKNERFLTKLLAHPTESPSTAVVMLDVCDFQRIDTKYGIRYGQKVLRRIAEVIHKNFPAECDVIRYYGDVFVIIMYNTTSDELLYHMSNVLSDISALEFPEHPSVVLKAVSGGCIIDELSLEALASADIMLQKAKRNKMKGLFERTTNSWSKEFSLDEFGHCD